MLSAEQANALSPAVLVQSPVFMRFKFGDLHRDPGDQRASDTARNAGKRAQILAEAIPAVSDAAGRVRIPGIPNIDMNSLKTGWPQERLNDAKKQNRWLHGDIKEPAYMYTYRLYGEWSQRSGGSQ